jgi:ABC-2 type transport system permease protein
MSGAIFIETLRRHWRGMLYWGIGLGVVALTRIIVVPDVDVLRQFTELMETLPAFMVQAFAGEDVTYMSTPEGYLSVAFLNFMLLFIGIYALIQGLNITANEEDRGILDVLLSLPVPRWRVMLEKFLAFALLVILLIVLMLVGIGIGLVMTPALAIDPTKLLSSAIGLLPGVLSILAFTALSGALLRSRAGAAGAASAFLAVSYFIDFVGRGASDSFDYQLRAISIFKYYDSSEIMRLGLNWANVGLLAALTLVFLSIALWAFERRDIGL